MVALRMVATAVLAAVALPLLAGCGEPAPSQVGANASASETSTVSAPTTTTPASTEAVYEEAIENTFLLKGFLNPMVVEGSYDSATNSARVNANIGRCNKQFDYLDGAVALDSFSTNTDARQILFEQSRFARCGSIDDIIPQDANVLGQPADPNLPSGVRTDIEAIFSGKGFTSPQVAWGSYRASTNSAQVNANIGECNLTFEYRGGAVRFASFSTNTDASEMRDDERFRMC